MLWKLNKDDITSSDRVRIASLSDFTKEQSESRLLEKDLEEFLSSHLTELVSEEHLMLLGQQRPRQEEPDILALDKDGNLYVFELKRHKSKSENLLQLLRYGQKFGRYTYDELQAWIRKQKEMKEGSLRCKHASHFQIPPLEESAFNRDQVFVLVTDGTDEDTISAANYWSGKGLKVVCLPYRVYSIDNHPYLEIQPYNPTGEVTAEREPKYFVVNTNKTWVSDAWLDMLGDGQTGKAAAYGTRKWAVSKIPRDSTVFLYHTGVGVIAKGTSEKEFRRERFGDDEDGEFNVPLKFDWTLSNENEWHDKAPKAWEINQELGSGHRFRQTAFAIGKKMVDAIDAIAKDKGIG